MLQSFTRVVGVVMLIAALVVTSLILITIFQVLFQPESVVAVQVVSDFLSAQLPLLSADIKGKSSSINVDPSGRLIIVYFVGTIVVVALSSLLHALIRGGILLLKYSEHRENDTLPMRE